MDADYVAESALVSSSCQPIFSMPILYGRRIGVMGVAIKKAMFGIGRIVVRGKVSVWFMYRSGQRNGVMGDAIK